MKWPHFVQEQNGLIFLAKVALHFLHVLHILSRYSLRCGGQCNNTTWTDLVTNLILTTTSKQF